MKTLTHQYCRQAYTNVYRTHLAIMVLFLLFIGSNSNGQQPELGTPPITNFAKSEFDAGTQNWCIAQDENGIVYFGNNKGLLSFNGREWTTYSLPNFTIVRSVSIPESGKIYVGGQNEFGYFQPQANGGKSYQSFTSLVPESENDYEDIWKNFQIDERHFFCSDWAIFVVENEVVSSIAPVGDGFENFFLVDGVLFVQDKTAGLFVLEDTKLKQELEASAIPQNRIVSILPKQENEQIIISAANGLLLSTSSGVIEWDCQVSEFLKENKAYCGIQLLDGNYAVGTTQNGVILFDSSGNITSHVNKEKGLQNNTILSLFQDKRRNLWLGLDNGIAYVEISSPFKFISSVEGIEGTGYTASTMNGKLILGTNQGLYSKPWPLDTAALKSQKFTQVKNSKGQVWNISVSDNDLIINRHDGTSLYQDSTLIPYSDVKGSWKFLQLKSHPQFAIQGTYNGFVLYKRASADSTKAWEIIGQLKGFDESARIFQEDKQGAIWVSHAYRGLYKLNLINDDDSLRIQSVQVFGSKEGLPNDLYINSSVIRGELVYATPEGIFYYNSKIDSFKIEEDLTKLLGEKRNVQSLLEDELGNIWFSIEDQFGVIKIKEQGVFNEIELLRFDQLQDDLVDGFEQIHAFDSQNIFIAAENGFIHYDGTKDHLSDFLFDIRINRVSDIGNNDSTIYVSGLSTADIKRDFSSDINSFKFSFNTPIYSMLNKVSYRFKLEGLETEWSNWTSRNEKEYTNLSEGEYTFVAQAKNAFGKLSNEASFKFEIHPPWYSSYLARIIYLCLGAIAMLLLFKFISKREAGKTEVFKEEQIKKLEQKEAEFKKEVSRTESELIQVRNDKLSSDIKHKNSELASTTMHLVQKSEILIKIKSDLSSLAKDAPHELRQKVKQIERTIEADVRLDKNWERFETYFDQVHQNFFKQLRSNYPELTPKDQKLCAYLRMNLTTKEIAPLLNISVRGVEISRYRLRKKMGLDSNTNLVSYIMEI